MRISVFESLLKPVCPIKEFGIRQFYSSIFIQAFHLGLFILMLINFNRNDNVNLYSVQVPQQSEILSDGVFLQLKKMLHRY